MAIRFELGLVFVLAISTATRAQETHLLGIDSNYVLDMEKNGRGWNELSGKIEPFTFFAANGCRDGRVRLWVGDDGPNRLNYATETAKRMQQAGLKPYLVLFLSEDWADMVKQPIPSVWKDLSDEQKLTEIEAYSESVVRHFLQQKIDIDTFEIGNEIDFGICGIFEEEWPKRVSIEFMRTRIWSRMHPILRAAQRGVLKAQPKAKFILHLSQWNNAEHCIAFWQAMMSAGFKLDYAGLSYFPSSVKEPEQRTFQFLQSQAKKIVEALHIPVLICETGFAATPDFGGQFADWKFEVDGYPMSDAGQAKWLADLVTLVRNDPNFAGVFYFSPEWYHNGIWDAFALFDGKGNARPATRSFQYPILKK